MISPSGTSMSFAAKNLPRPTIGGATRVTTTCRFCSAASEISSCAISSTRRGWTPFSGSSNASSEPPHGFAAIAHRASARRVPSETMRDE